MILSLLIYALAVSTLLVTGAWAAERALRPVRISTRILWVASIAGSAALVMLAATGMYRNVVPTDGIAASVQLPAIDVLAVDAVLSGATRFASRLLPASVDTALGVAWMLSSLVTLALISAGAVQQRRMLRASRAAIVAGVRVWVSESFGPAVVGVIAPKVVLPRWLLSRGAAEQELVLAHEQEHIAVHDPALLVAGAAGVVLMPWNPLLWWAFARVRLAMELDCDARVLRAGAPALAYGSLLLDLTAALPPARLGAAAFAARPSQLEQRILAMSVRPFSARRRAAAIAAALVLGAVAAVAACSADVSDAVVTPDGTETARPAVPPIVVAPTASEISSDAPYFDFQVEKVVTPVLGTGVPRYPAILRSAGVEGEVLAQFVVDTLGRIEIESFRAVRKTHDLFEASIRTALPAMRFTPAEVRGRKVRQLVQQPFVFALAR